MDDDKKTDLLPPVAPTSDEREPLDLTELDLDWTDGEPLRAMKFVGGNPDTIVPRSLFNTIRLGDKWRDLSVNEEIALVFVETTEAIRAKAEGREPECKPMGTALVLAVGYLPLDDALAGHIGLNMVGYGTGMAHANRRDEIALDLHKFYGRAECESPSARATVVYLWFPERG